MISVKEAAEMLQVSQKTIYKWIKAGKLPLKQLGNQYYLERADVTNLMTDDGNSIPHISSADAEGDIAISEMLVKAGIFYSVSGNNVKEVLYNALSKIKGVDAQMMDPIYRMFLSREELASTGIGNGIAIPHARGTLVGYVSQPLLSLAFLEHPVDFQAVDGKPVHALFMLISPNVKTHLRSLSKLAFLLQDEACRQVIMQQAEPATIIDVFTAAEAGYRKAKQAELK